MHGGGPSSEIHTTDLPRNDMITLELRDVDRFMLNQTHSMQDFHKFALADLSDKPLHLDVVSMVRASARAWNRVACRLRAQEGYEVDRLLVEQQYAFPGVPSSDAVYCEGRAVVFRVWVPTPKREMSDEVVDECEREIWR